MQTIRGFENLSEEELKHLIEVPALVTFLVAGSDNNIDEQERDWAEKLVEFRSMKNDGDLIEYYNQVERQWDDNFHKNADKMNEYQDPKLRCEYLSDQLKRCNDILPKLDDTLASKLYEGFRSFARQVAMSSGGILGIGAISPEENQWVKLKMINNPAK